MNIVNLANIELTSPQISVLQKGLGFVPTSRLDKFKLLCETTEFIRRIKLHAFFKNIPDNNTNRNESGLKKKSDFVPPAHSIPVEILTFEKAVMKEINDLNTDPNKTFHNLTKEEHLALRERSNDKSITIKPADKGGATVILSTQMYRKECLRLLSDETTYKN